MNACKIFLGNLSWDVTRDCLADLLKDEGYDFKSVKVILNHETGLSRGIAFVEFETPEAATEAIAGLHGYIIAGRPLRAMEAIDRSNRDNSGKNRGYSAEENHSDKNFERIEQHALRYKW